MDIINNQQAMNLILCFSLIVIIAILVKLSIVQDAIKDKIDEILKNSNKKQKVKNKWEIQ